jgi:hypothetical protein
MENHGRDSASLLKIKRKRASLRVIEYDLSHTQRVNGEEEIEGGRLN